MKQITVRLDDGVHRRVKMRAAADGLAMEAIGRVWFEAYAAGGTVVASTESTVRLRDLPGGGLGAGGETSGVDPDPLRGVSGPPAPSPPLDAVSPDSTDGVRVGKVSLRPHRADPKDKAAQEHGKGDKKTAKGLCPHRVPNGSFCRRCEEGT